METLYSILSVADWICFILWVPCVFYLLFYAVASKFNHPKQYQETAERKRFAVLFPAYRADHIILSSVGSFLEQDYPAEQYDVIVIADHMEETTCEQLRKMGAQVLVATYENSSKAKALVLAMDSIDVRTYDSIVIMDADNTTAPHFLTELNKATVAGIRVIQAHRTAKNLDTDIAILDAVSEEINNSIFRSGHVALGLSSALIGSGMALDASWFRQNVTRLQTAGEDKELEALLLKQRIPIAYLENVWVEDEKTQKKEVIKHQRKRWLAAQFGSLFAALPDLPGALLRGNIDYADKIIQWMFPPRIILLAGAFFLSILTLLISPEMSLKWWILSIILAGTLVIAIPQRLMNLRLLKALWQVPALAILMIANLFKLRGVNKKFIHTEHSKH